MFNQILSLDLCAFDLRVLGTTDRSLIGFGEAYFVSLTGWKPFKVEVLHFTFRPKSKPPSLSEKVRFDTELMPKTLF